MPSLWGPTARHQYSVPASVAFRALRMCCCAPVQMPLPLLLEHVVSPLLHLYTSSPQALSKALLAVCTNALGGTLTARHVMPSVLQAALVPNASGNVMSHPGGRTVSPAHPTATAGPLVQQIDAALGFMEALADLLPKEYLPRLFLGGSPGHSHHHHAAPLSPSASSSHGNHQHFHSQQQQQQQQQMLSSSFPGASAPMLAAAAAGGNSATPGSPAPARTYSTESAGTALDSGLAPPPLQAALLWPQHYVVTPGSLTRLARVVLRSFERLSRPDNLATVLLPHFKGLLLMGVRSGGGGGGAEGSDRAAASASASRQLSGTVEIIAGSASISTRSTGSAASSGMGLYDGNADLGYPGTVGATEPHQGYWQLVHTLHR